MSQVTDGNRSGLLPEGPIVDPALALALSAYALRRFSAETLAHYIRMSAYKANEWITANAGDLQVVEEGLRPPGETGTVWQRTPAANDAFSFWLKSASPLEVHIRLHGDWRYTVESIPDLDRAEEYLCDVELCESDEVRRDCLDWVGLWLKSARSRLESHQSIDSVVSPGIEERLVAQEARLAATPRTMSLPDHA